MFRVAVIFDKQFQVSEVPLFFRPIVDQVKDGYDRRFSSLINFLIFVFN